MAGVLASASSLQISQRNSSHNLMLNIWFNCQLSFWIGDVLPQLLDIVDDDVMLSGKSFFFINETSSFS